MKRITLLSLALTLSLNASSQQRIGLDLGTRLLNYNLTATYNRVIKGGLLYSVGVFGGQFGYSQILNDTMNLYTGGVPKSPFNSVNESIRMDTATFQLLDYDSRANGLGIQFGLGYFWEFGKTHGLRVNMNQRIGFASQRVGAWYRSTDVYKTIRKEEAESHWFGGTTSELYHTIRTSGRNTFYYGLKLPFYYTLDANNFAPTNPKDILNGFEPELVIGFTRVIGNCD